MHSGTEDSAHGVVATEVDTVTDAGTTGVGASVLEADGVTTVAGGSVGAVSRVDVTGEVWGDGVTPTSVETAVVDAAGASASAPALVAVPATAAATATASTTAADVSVTVGTDSSSMGATECDDVGEVVSMTSPAGTSWVSGDGAQAVTVAAMAHSEGSVKNDTESRDVVAVVVESVDVSGAEASVHVDVVDADADADASAAAAVAVTVDADVDVDADVADRDTVRESAAVQDRVDTRIVFGSMSMFGGYRGGGYRGNVWGRDSATSELSEEEGEDDRMEESGGKMGAGESDSMLQSVIASLYARAGVHSGTEEHPSSSAPSCHVAEYSPAQGSSAASAACDANDMGAWSLEQSSIHEHPHSSSAVLDDDSVVAAPDATLHPRDVEEPPLDAADSLHAALSPEVDQHSGTSKTSVSGSGSPLLPPAAPSSDSLTRFVALMSRMSQDMNALLNIQGSEEVMALSNRLFGRRGVFGGVGGQHRSVWGHGFSCIAESDDDDEVEEEDDDGDKTCADGDGKSVLGTASRFDREGMHASAWLNRSSASEHAELATSAKSSTSVIASAAVLEPGAGDDGNSCSGNVGVTDADGDGDTDGDCSAHVTASDFFQECKVIVPAVDLSDGPGETVTGLVEGDNAAAQGHSSALPVQDPPSQDTGSEGRMETWDQLAQQRQLRFHALEAALLVEGADCESDVASDVYHAFGGVGVSRRSVWGRESVTISQEDDEADEAALRLVVASLFAQRDAENGEELGGGTRHDTSISTFAVETVSHQPETPVDGDVQSDQRRAAVNAAIASAEGTSVSRGDEFDLALPGAINGKEIVSYSGTETTKASAASSIDPGLSTPVVHVNDNLGTPSVSRVTADSSEDGVVRDSALQRMGASLVSSQRSDRSGTSGSLQSVVDDEPVQGSVTALAPSHHAKPTTVAADSCEVAVNVAVSSAGELLSEASVNDAHAPSSDSPSFPTTAAVDAPSSSPFAPENTSPLVRPAAAAGAPGEDTLRPAAVSAMVGFPGSSSPPEAKRTGLMLDTLLHNAFVDAPWQGASQFEMFADDASFGIMAGSVWGSGDHSSPLSHAPAPSRRPSLTASVDMRYAVAQAMRIVDGILHRRPSVDSLSSTAGTDPSPMLNATSAAQARPPSVLFLPAAAAALPSFLTTATKPLARPARTSHRLPSLAMPTSTQQSHHVLIRSAVNDALKVVDSLVHTAQTLVRANE